jgi:hypothetical protein
MSCNLLQPVIIEIYNSSCIFLFVVCVCARARARGRAPATVTVGCDSWIRSHGGCGVANQAAAVAVIATAPHGRQSTAVSGLPQTF